MHNTVNIDRLQKDVEKILQDIEKLKDASREMKFTNGGIVMEVVSSSPDVRQF